MSYAPQDIIFMVTTLGLVGTVAGGFVFAIASKLLHLNHRAHA